MFRRNVPASRFFSKRGSRCPGSQSHSANTPSFWLFGSWSNVETQSISQFAKKNFHLSVCIWFLVSSMSEPATGPVDMHWSTDLQAWVQSPLTGHRSFFCTFCHLALPPTEVFCTFCHLALIGYVTNPFLAGNNNNHGVTIKTIYCLVKNYAQ